MNQYNSLNVKLSNSQLIKLNSAMKNSFEATLNRSSNVIGSSNDDINFPQKLLSTNRNVSILFKAFASSSSVNIKLLKTQYHKIGQSGEF